MHELIQSEIQSDIISENFLSLPAEVFRFRSVKYTLPLLGSFGSVLERFFEWILDSIVPSSLQVGL